MMIEQLNDIVGAAYVLTGDDTAKWATDWTGAYTADPIAVVRPADTAEVAAVLKLAHDADTPVVPVSGNTGLTGGTSGKGMLMLSVDRLNTIADIDAAGRTATVGAGVILSNLHAAAEAKDLIFPLTFGARGSAMVGGALSTNAGGSNVVRYGNTRDLVLGLEVVMADGQIMNLMGRLHKDNAGLNLKHLMIGAEGTLGIITAAVVKLFPKPRAYATAMVAVPALEDALSLLHQMQDATGGAVEAFEYMPRDYIESHLQLFGDARMPFDQHHDVNIMIEIAAIAPSDATPGPDGKLPLTTLLEDTLGQLLENDQIIDAVIAQNEAQRAEMWERREVAGEIAFHRKPFVNTDVALPLEDIAPFLTRAKADLAVLDPKGVDHAIAHLGDGNIHYTVYPSRDDAMLKDQITEMVEDIVQDMGGSFSAEHGVGVSKLATMQRRKDPTALAAMIAIKSALDPKGILNPGKVFPN